LFRVPIHGVGNERNWQLTLQYCLKQLETRLAAGCPHALDDHVALANLLHLGCFDDHGKSSESVL
jgi:hypothetical protein